MVKVLAELLLKALGEPGDKGVDTAKGELMMNPKIRLEHLARGAAVLHPAVEHGKSRSTPKASVARNQGVLAESVSPAALARRSGAVHRSGFGVCGRTDQVAPQSASGKFLSASRSGVYHWEENAVAPVAGRRLRAAGE